MNSNYGQLLGITSIIILCLAIPIYLSRDVSTQNPPLIQGTEMSDVKILVSVDDAHLPQIQQVSQQLQSSGMNVEQTLSTIGVISGSVQPDKLNNLYQIEGVKNVESQESYKLAPPNSDIQ